MSEITVVIPYTRKHEKYLDQAKESAKGASEVKAIFDNETIWKINELLKQDEKIWGKDEKPN